MSSTNKIEGLSYKQAGVDIELADAAKREMARTLETNNARVLNRVGAFASLFDISFPDYQHPVLVCKTEEPGSKQKLCFAHKRQRSICFDMVNHLVNDIIVMGAKPLAVQDAIICGRLDKEVVNEVVRGIADACAAQDCVLTGGETSEQPGVLEPGTYILTSSIIGVVEKAKIIDGSSIKQGDCVLALASSGLHTNGYSLVRSLLERFPMLAQQEVAGESFLEQILRPHLCYYQALKGLFSHPGLKGMAHITGGGIRDNLKRVLPTSCSAQIDLEKVQILPIFRAIRQQGGVSDEVMLRTFNLGVGLIVVVAPEALAEFQAHLAHHAITSYQIGEIVVGMQDVVFQGSLAW